MDWVSWQYRSYFTHLNTSAVSFYLSSKCCIKPGLGLVVRSFDWSDHLLTFDTHHCHHQDTLQLICDFYSVWFWCSIYWNISLNSRGITVPFIEWSRHNLLDLKMPRRIISLNGSRQNNWKRKYDLHSIHGLARLEASSSMKTCSLKVCRIISLWK